MADKLVTLNLVGTIEGVTVVAEKAQIPLKLLVNPAGKDNFYLTNLIKQNVLKLVPTLGVRNAEALRKRVNEIKAELDAQIKAALEEADESDG